MIQPTTTKALRPFLKVKLFRGFIGLPKNIKIHARALGLTKRFQTVYLKPVSTIVGNLLKIKELVKVELVNSIPPKVTKRPSSFQVTGSFLPNSQLYRYQQPH